MTELDLTRRPTGDYYDPDAGLDPALRQYACGLSCSFFHRLRVTPGRICDESSGNQLPGFMYVEAGGEVHLVFVRVTVEDEFETGAGPMPGILIDQACMHNAQAHVVRVHARRVECGVNFSYFGHEELVEELRLGEWWRRKLLRGRAARDYLQAAGGKPSRLELLIKHEQPGMRQREPSDFELAKIFSEDLKSPYYFHGAVTIGLRVTPDPRTRTDYAFISVCSLLASTHLNDEFYIFTCDCGSAGCAGIWAGVDVVHEDGLVVWLMRGNKPRRLLVFDHDQYRQEIFTKVRAALAVVKATGPEALFQSKTNTKFVEEALYRAEERAA